MKIEGDGIFIIKFSLKWKINELQFKIKSKQFEIFKSKFWFTLKLKCYKAYITIIMIHTIQFIVTLTVRVTKLYLKKLK